MSSENKYVLSNVIEKFGEDDFTLWTVELHESDLKATLTDFLRVSGSPAQVLKSLPTISLSTPETTLNLIYSNPKGCEILSADVNKEFFDRYRNDGCSVHGSLQEILDELGSVINDGKLEQQEAQFMSQPPDHSAIYFLYSNENRLVFCSTTKSDVYIVLGNEIFEGRMEYNGLSGKSGFALFRQDYRADEINDDLITNGCISESDNYLITEYAESDEYTDVLEWLTMSDGEYDRIANFDGETDYGIDAGQDDEFER